MKWALSERGFLPTPDPLTTLSDRWTAVERLAAQLPELVADQRFREVAPVALRDGFDPATLADLADSPDHEVERLFALFCYFASAYVHLPGLPPATRLPAEIAAPLVRLAQRCGRPPILSYASYCLYNWRRIDPQGPVALGNIELLQNFAAPGDGKDDEDWFILVHVDVEARAGAGLIALDCAGRAAGAGDLTGLERELRRLADSLRDVNRSMARMPEGCRPEVYFRKVRPYIFGFDGVEYEGHFEGAAQKYRGETGAQTAIVPALLVGLGVEHKNSLLTTHLEDMRRYMPPPHREFVQSRVNVRASVTRAGPGNGLRETYNACLDELIAFRSRHFEYAVNYIERRTANPLATGGTPYVPWLHQLIEETKTHYLR